MRDYLPHWRETYSVAVPMTILGAEALLRVPGPDFDGGATSLWIWEMYRDNDLYAQSGPAARAHLDAEVGLRAAVARTLAPEMAPNRAVSIY